MANIYDMSDLWNDAGTTFTGIGLNVTDTASSASSLLMDLQVGGTSKFSVGKGGNLVGSVASATSPHEFNAGGTGRFGFYQASSYVFSLGYNSSPTGTLLPIFSTQGSSRFLLNSNIELCWTSSTSVATDGDLKLHRDAANTLAQRNSTNAQTFNIYNTYTDASNYERGFMKWNANVLEIGSEAAGTGLARNVAFKVNGTSRLTVNTTGSVFNGTITSGNFSVDSVGNRLTVGGAFSVADGSSQIGALVYNNGYLGFASGVVALGSSPDTTLRRSDAAIIGVRGATSVTGGSLEFIEQTAPAAGSATSARIFAEDDGAGKTRLMVQFGTGAAQQIAIEP